MGDQLFTGQNQVGHFRVDRRRSTTVFAAGQVFDFARYDFVATEHDVEGRHRTGNLTGRRDERRISEVGADFWHFFQHILIFVFHSLLFQLVEEVRQHAAGDLKREDFGVDIDRSVQFESFRDTFLDGAEVVGDRVQIFFGDAGIPFRSFEGGDQRFGCRLRRTHGKGRQRTVDDIDAGFNRFQISHRGHAAGIMRMDIDRDRNCRFQGLDQVVGYVRS